MQFLRLRLAGFKSFVEPTEFRIEPGLTGVVGPNGCGKSNLLEALRWVMGANSPKAMRGAGMDDVIFAGSGGRPGRNHAEVTLTIEGADGAAPGGWGAAATLEVARRIDRGAGSSFRINGREVRARDVQLLFADASTGANSPALVRQGQISELIAARPQNRRLILEEAAGVAGLHARRHEAELKAGGAQANLTRLDDLVGELDQAFARLRREARQAERYRKISAQIRSLQGAALHARWLEARAALQRLDLESRTAERAVETAVRAAALASAAAATAETAIRPLRDEETAAAAVLHRLDIEKDRLERELAAAAATLSRLAGEIGRIDEGREREAQIERDAAAALQRLDGEMAKLELEIAAAPERLPELAAAAREAQGARQRADAEVERLAAEAAAAEARRRAAAMRLEDARARLGRTTRALEQAKSERAALAPAEGGRLEAAAVAASGAEARLLALRQALESAEADAADAARAQGEARLRAQAAQDRLAALEAEAAGLGELGRRDDGFAPVLDEVTPAPGLERALAAALGADAEAALDPRAPAHWAGAQARPPAWPEGATPLADLVRAPPQLAARLAFVALVEPADGPRLMRLVAPGARLVSRAGDLWRWDGFVARADAPTPAAVRLEQRSRLARLADQIAALTPGAVEAAAAAATAEQRLARAAAALESARAAPRHAEAAVHAARQALAVLEREGARLDARAQSLDETIGRFEAERAELAGEADAAAAGLAGVADGAAAAAALARARTLAAQARALEAGRRAALDLEQRERDARRQRLASLAADRADWTARRLAADRRLDALARQRRSAEAGLAACREAPARIERDRVRLLDELGTAQARRASSADALELAEAARTGADRSLRAAEAAAAAAREQRASLAARLDGARDRFAEAAAAIRDQAGLEPEALGARLSAEAVAAPPEARGLEAHLAVLERERELIGPVNLRAEEEAAELGARLQTLKGERDDLIAALAKLRQGVAELNADGRERLAAAFGVIDAHFRALFTSLFEGGQAELRLVESEDPLEAGLEIYACPPGKRLALMSLMSGGEQALTAAALIFAVFLANPAPICVLDEVDAPLDDANVERFCNLLDEMRRRAPTRFVAITHNPLTMSRMDRLFGVTMSEAGVSQLVSVDLRQAETLAAQ
ncbi:MAG TPA: chromosome segregation protein SMC [Caulobacteraceae bacterium]|nr:chromosome segregation protein SMC [Caulobacteraceae bacterium]